MEGEYACDRLLTKLDTYIRNLFTKINELDPLLETHDCETDDEFVEYVLSPENVNSIITIWNSFKPLNQTMGIELRFHRDHYVNVRFEDASNSQFAVTVSLGSYRNFYRMVPLDSPFVLKVNKKQGHNTYNTFLDKLREYLLMMYFEFKTTLCCDIKLDDFVNNILDEKTVNEIQSLWILFSNKSRSNTMFSIKLLIDDNCFVHISFEDERCDVNKFVVLVKPEPHNDFGNFNKSFSMTVERK